MQLASSRRSRSDRHDRNPGQLDLLDGRVRLVVRQLGGRAFLCAIDLNVLTEPELTTSSIKTGGPDLEQDERLIKDAREALLVKTRFAGILH